MSDDLSSFSLAALFQTECESQCRVLSDNLLALEKNSHDPAILESLMRAAHSLKGAARIIDLEGAVQVAHAMEESFVSAQQRQGSIDSTMIDHLLSGIDLLARLATAAAPAHLQPQVAAFLAGPPEQAAAAPGTQAAPPETTLTDNITGDARTLRVTSDSLDLMLASAGESLVAWRRIRNFANHLRRLHSHQRQTATRLEAAITAAATGENPTPALRHLQAMVAAGDQLVLTSLAEFDRFERNASDLSQRLYGQALACRMMPFGSIAPSLRRAVRDTARRLGRDVSFQLRGETVEVDRDLLEKIESPLLHLLRNAIDHGLESPPERAAAGKPATGLLVIEASHSAGFLIIRVTDDGRGVDHEHLRSQVVTRGLTDALTATHLGHAELLEFLFLPGFSLRSEVTEISGRGVGLDVVQAAVRDARGTVRMSSTPAQGTALVLQLPISLSVLKALVFQIAGEPYAIPLAKVERVLCLPAADLESVEGVQYVTVGQSRVGIVDGAAVLGRPLEPAARDQLNLLLLATPAGELFGVVVSRFLGAGEIVVQALDQHLGRVRDIAAAALTEDGAPMLLIDVEDFLLSVRRMAAGGPLPGITAKSSELAKAQRQILVVDDSLTVRELERKLLTSLGYAVEVAVDGMDGWNAARTGRFAAIITDVDMPRMDGIELTRLIKNDARLRETPVIIVSYKDRAEDRLRGLDAGADHYLTKGSFQDASFARAVAAVLGEDSPS
ncbi:MAG: response regulator [Verrucomicrobia bacterium]|nr:response regulator [Verrucomicrobiota bacterium]